MNTLFSSNIEYIDAKQNIKSLPNKRTNLSNEYEQIEKKKRNLINTSFIKVTGSIRIRHDFKN